MRNSQEYVDLAEESDRKLREMADMVIQMESEKDMLQEEYIDFKTQVFNRTCCRKNTMISKHRFLIGHAAGGIQ